MKVVKIADIKTVTNQLSYLAEIHCGQDIDDIFVFFLMIRRPPRSTQGRSSAASDVYKRQGFRGVSESSTSGVLFRDHSHNIHPPARDTRRVWPVSYTHLRAHETPEHLVCRLLLEKKNIIYVPTYSQAHLGCKSPWYFRPC